MSAIKKNLSLHPFSRQKNPILIDFYANQQFNTDFYKNHPIVHKVIGIPLPMYQRKHSFYWVLNSSSEFSASSTTWIPHGIQNHCNSYWSFNRISKIDTKLKIKAFLCNFIIKLCMGRVLFSEGALVLIQFVHLVLLILNLQNIFLRSV